MKGPCFLWKKRQGGAIFNNHDDIADFLVSPCLTWDSLSPVWLGTALIRRVQGIFLDAKHGMRGPENLRTKRKRIVSQPAHGFRQALENCSFSDFFAFGNFMILFHEWNMKLRKESEHFSYNFTFLLMYGSCLLFLTSRCWRVNLTAPKFPSKHRQVVISNWYGKSEFLQHLP